MATYTATGGILVCVGTDITTADIVSNVNSQTASLSAVAGQAPVAFLHDAKGGTSGTAPFTFYGKLASYIIAEIQIGESGGPKSLWLMEDEDVYINGDTFLQVNGDLFMGTDNGDGTYSNPVRFRFESANSTTFLAQAEKWLLSHESSITAFLSTIITEKVITFVDGTNSASGASLTRCTIVVTVLGHAITYDGPFTNPATVTIDQCVFDGVDAPNFSTGLQTTQDITYNITNTQFTNFNFGLQCNSVPLILRGLSLDTCTVHAIYNLAAAADVTFIDSDFIISETALRLEPTGLTAADITKLEVTHDITIFDSVGAPITGARMWLKDQTGSIRYGDDPGDVTDSSGVPQNYGDKTVQQSTYAGGTKTERKAHTRKIRAFGFFYDESTFDAAEPITADKGLLTNANADTLGVTLVAVNGSDETITVTASRTAKQIYNAAQEYGVGDTGIAFDEAMLTADGVNFDQLAGWKISSNQPISGGINLTSDFELTADVDLTAHNITGAGNALILTVADGAEYTITDSTIDDIINTGVGSITVFSVNSTINPSPTGPNVTVTVSPTPTGVSAPNLTAGRVQLFNVTTVTEIENTTITSGYSRNWLNGTDATNGDTLRLRWVQDDGAELEAFFIAAVDTIVTILDASQPDDTYIFYNIDGSTVTKFTADYVDDEVDLNIGSNFSGAEFYAFWKFNLTTSQGIADFFGGITALDVANIRINNATVNLFFDNLTNTSVFQTDNIRLYRNDEVYPVKQPTTGSGGIDVVWRDKIFIAVTGSGVTVQDKIDIKDLVFDEFVEGTETFRQQVRLMRSEAAGKVSVSGTTVIFRDAADSKDRITATVDEDGQRTAVTVDGD